MSSATTKLAGGARRALVGRAGAAVQLGAPPSWPGVELARVRSQAGALARGRARRQAPRMIGLAVTAASVAAVLGVGAAESFGAAVLGVVAWWIHQIGAETPVVAQWRAWARGRHALERELRLLGSNWRLLWDRRIHGLPAPAVIAVGPSGAWALWSPEPGLESHADLGAAASAVAEIGGLPAVAHVVGGPSAALRTFVHEMACAPLLASRDEVLRAAERLDTTLLQEPVGAGL